MNDITWYTVAVKTPYKSSRKILLSENTSLSALADCILDTYGIVKDRACFFFSGDTPWEGTLYTDTAEFPKYLNIQRIPFESLAEEESRFVFQVGYEPEFVFDCFIDVSTKSGSDAPEVIYSKGGTVSEFLPVDEDELYFEMENCDVDDSSEEECVVPIYSDIDLVIDRYLRSFVALYGVIPKKKAVEMILYYEPEMPVSEIRQSMRYLPMIDSRKDYTVTQREIVYTELLEMQSGEYFALKKVQRGKEYYLPQKEELLLYADPLYVEPTSAFKELESSIGKRVAEELYRMMQGGISPTEAIALEAKILKREPYGEKELTLAETVEKRIRRWENRGFPQEV